MPHEKAYEKVFETSLTVENPIHLAADKRGGLLKLLQDQYEGKCFKGAHIRKVVRILQTSALTVVRTNLSGAAAVDVRFLALVDVFAAWDILVGVRIVQRSPLVLGSYEAPGGARAVVAFLPSQRGGGVEAAAVGQLVAARVVQPTHAPMQDKASVVATLLTCDGSAPAFRVRGGLDAAARAELEPLLAAVGSELRARAEVASGPEGRAALWFFERLLYAFRARPPLGAAGPPPDQRLGEWKGAPPWEGPAGADAEGGPAQDETRAPRPPGRAESRNVLELVGRVVAGESVGVTGVWSRPLALYRSSPLACCAPDGPPGADAAPLIDSEPRAVFAGFLKNILDFLAATRELARLHPRPEAAGSEAYAGLWAAMRVAQAQDETPALRPPAGAHAPPPGSRASGLRPLSEAPGGGPARARPSAPGASDV